MNKLIEDNPLTLISGGRWIQQLSEPGKRWLVQATLFAGLMADPSIEEMKDVLPENMIEAVITESVKAATSEDIDEFVEKLVHHLVEGTDTTPNSKAFGGFNQNELNILEDLVKAAQTL